MANTQQSDPRAAEVRLYTYEEAAELLGANISARQVRRWVEDGRLGFIQLPFGRRIKVEHIAAFIAANNRAPSE